MKSTMSSPNPKDSRFRRAFDRIDDISPAGAAFSQVSGVLGGFCATIVVLALGPGIVVADTARDWIVAMLLLAAGIYITSAGILANAISFKAKEVSRATYSTGIFLFHLANLFLSTGILVLTYQFPMIVSRLVGIIICVVAFVIAAINMLPLLLSAEQ